jgi:hypothetical protein
VNEPAATSYWQRVATRAREAIGGVRGSCAATAAVQEYSRVIPVLAGQVREAASSIEHAVLEVTTSIASSVERARRVVSSVRARSAARASEGELDAPTASARQALARLHERGLDRARRSIETAARIEDAVCALKVISLRLDPSAPSDLIRGLVTDLERSLTTAMSALRHSADADAASLVQETQTAGRAIEQLGARDGDMRRELETAAHEAEQLAEAAAHAAAALLAHDRSSQRLQNVIDTLSEMQDEFVDALERPQKRAEPSGSAALRLRQRYTAAAAPR